MQAAPLRPIVWIWFLLCLVPFRVQAQSPASVAGRAAEMTVTSGDGPFASNGSFRLLMSAVDGTYGVVATSGGVSSSYGTATYSKTGTNSAAADFSDSVAGSGLRATFQFASATTGSYVLTVSAAPGYSQRGTFRLYNGQPPASVKGTTFDVQVQAGVYPFADYGSFKLATDPVTNNYRIYGGSGVTPSSGTYVYTPGASGTSSVVLRDSVTGASMSQTLSWDSSSAGAYVVRDSAQTGYQAGTFRVESVSLPPVISVQPAGMTLSAGTTALLRVVASSSDPLSYQWRKNGVSIPGATGASLTLASVTGPSAGTYDVVLTNAAGSVTSAAATILVVVPPTIVTPPAPFSARIGDTGSLDVVVNGTPPFTFVWRKDGVVVPGATGATLFFNSVTQADYGTYTVEVSNGAGRVASAPAGFSQGTAVSILAQPSSVTTRNGAAATFSVVARGTEPLSYQWRKNGSLIPGATRSVYTVPRATAEEAGNYEVFVVNAFGDATSNAARLEIAGNRGISFVSFPEQPVASELTVVRGTGAKVPVAIDPVDPRDARTTCQLVRLSGDGLVQAVGSSAPVSSGGTLAVLLPPLVESGAYALEYIRQYSDGSPAVKVLSEPFTLEVVSLDAAAGNYEMVLEDSDHVVPDGAVCRGVLLVTTTKSGSVSGRLFYNEAPEVAGTDEPARRLYAPVTRSFSGRFVASETDPGKLVCVPKLGVGAQANRQQLRLELDLTTNPPSLGAVVVDRVSVPPDVAEEGTVSTASAVTRNISQLPGLQGLQSGEVAPLAGRYNMAASEPFDAGVSGGADRRAYILTQVLSSGRAVWVSRLAGFSGSGSAGLRAGEAGDFHAPFYEGRLTRSAKLHQSHSLLGSLRWDNSATGAWQLYPGAGYKEGVIERQSAYVTVHNGTAGYSEKFQTEAAGTKDFNWACITPLDFGGGNSCTWNGASKDGIFQHFSLNPTSAAELTPRLCTLSVEDPAEGVAYEWSLSISSSGAVRVLSSAPGQPVLSLRFDKTKGEFSGAYVSPADKLRRIVAGATVRDPADESVRASGWVEFNAVPATKTTGWQIRLPSQ